MASEVIKNVDEAKRFARVIISDIAAYNFDKIKSGIENDTLFDNLKTELEEGEIYYRTRVDKTLLDKHNFFNQAIVDILIKPKTYIDSKIW